MVVGLGKNSLLKLGPLMESIRNFLEQIFTFHFFSDAGPGFFPYLTLRPHLPWSTL